MRTVLRGVEAAFEFLPQRDIGRCSFRESDIHVAPPTCPWSLVRQKWSYTEAYTLAAYTLDAYIGRMVFVELTPFVAFREEYWTDEDLQKLQSFLLVAPDAGDLIRGGAGLRKLRWSAQGRGKRGGARVIYYWRVPNHHIYLIYGYVKSRTEDLTTQQTKVLRELMKDIDDG
jgi:hypothetical protein